MRDDELEQWAKLVDQEACGDALSSAERRQRRQIERKRDECATETKIYECLETALTRASSLSPVDDPLIQRALSNVADEPGIPLVSRVRRSPFVIVGFAAGAALVFVVGAWLWSRPSGSAGVASSPVEAVQPAKLQLASGDVWVNGAQIGSGTELGPQAVVQTGSGRACVGFADGTTACVGSDSAAKLSSLGDHREIDLTAGHIAVTLEKQPSGRSFSVSTPRGRVTAVGTMFGVEVAEDGATTLRVEEGQVRAHSRAGEQLVSKAEQHVLGSGRVDPISEADSAKDVGLLGASRLWSPSLANELVLGTEPRGARVLLDGIELGRAPLSVDVPSGRHELRVEHEGYTPIERTLKFTGEPVNLDLKLTPASQASTTPWAPATNEPSRSRGAPLGGSRDARVGSGAADAKQAVPGAKPSSGGQSASSAAAELLEKARRARAGGAYQSAATSYRNLISVHPGSPEARVATLSLAELELSTLGNAAGALRLYDNYLRSGGGLAREAYYGKIRSLRALGRVGDEKRAINGFLKRYPSSAYAGSLRKRLQSL